MAKKCAFAAMFALIFIITATAAIAQSTTATISGRITDPSGGVLTGVQVTTTNTGTGLKRTVTSDAQGRYVVPNLAPGTYELSATTAGFETLMRQGITLTVGQAADLDLSMKVGAVTEQVTVMEEAPLLNTSSSAVSSVVEEKRIQELPLNGRDFSQLPLIQAGVAAIRNGDSTITKGYGARVSMGGSRPDQTAWLLDGTNIHNLSNFGTPGSAAGVMLGVDAVREFQVLTSNYSAELGGTSGGVVNMVSKSGTNGLHGTAYEFLRNSKLDARNFFDKDKPPFKRNQFGASIGGPIKKDKAFFFGNYEGLRQRQQVTSLPKVLDASVHQGLIPDGKGNFTQVQISPAIKPYLDLWPLPTSNILSNGNPTGIGILSATASSPVTENFFVIRGDVHLNEKQSLFGRVNYDQSSLSTPDTIPLFSKNVGSHSRYVTLQHDYIVSGTFLMTTRLAYNRSLLLGDESALFTYPDSLNIFQPGWLPALTVTGTDGFGPNATNQLHRPQNVWDFAENLQDIHGSHSMKFGFEGQRVDATKNGEVAGSAGAFTWDNIQSFLTDGTISAFGAVSPGSARNRTWFQKTYGLYFQDDWKWRPNFTWNLGIRYEPYSSPTEKHDRVAMVQDWVHDTTFSTNIGLFDNPSKKNFSPRVGFAWSPGTDGKTSIRGGFGIFYVNIGAAYYITPGGKNPPYFATAQAPVGQKKFSTSVADWAIVGPSLLTANMTPNTFMELIQWDLKSSYEMKANFTIQRQLPHNIAVSIGYLGNRGIHLWRNSDVNEAPFTIVNGREFVAAGTPRVNPIVSVGTTRYSDAQAFYNGLQTEVKKNFSHGFQLQSTFTWSKNIDDATTGLANTDFLEGVSSQAYNPKVDRGLSALNQGKNFSVNMLYALPSPWKTGIASHITEGWQLSTIFSAATGTPFSERVSGRNAPDLSRTTGSQRPDPILSRDNSNTVSGTSTGCGGVKSGTPLGTPDLYFDPCAFVLPPAGFYGIAGRNTLIGPGYENLDFSLLKSTPLGIKEGSRLEFRAEFFNLLNRANFALPGSSLQVLNPTNGQYIAGAGRINSTITPSRQMQFGMKIIF
jgi:outer membrane receptor protein involved in Fe transport